MDIFKLIKQNKPDMQDLEHPFLDSNQITVATQPPAKFDVVEPKMDGWFSILCFGDGEAVLYSAGADIKKVFTLENKSIQGICPCEYIYGTNFASTHPKLAGNIYLHDCLEINESPTSKMDYLHRRGVVRAVIKAFNDPTVQEMPMYNRSMWCDLWQVLVQEQHYEGLVFKQLHSYLGTPNSIARMKASYTQDYVCMGMSEGAGRLAGKMGAMIGGLYIEGVLTAVCSVGGGFSDSQRAEMWANQSAYLGRVFVANGKQLFSGGALRHPNFGDGRGNYWRLDKRPEDCIL